MPTVVKSLSNSQMSSRIPFQIAYRMCNIHPNSEGRFVFSGERLLSSFGSRSRLQKVEPSTGNAGRMSFHSSRPPKSSTFQARKRKRTLEHSRVRKRTLASLSSTSPPTILNLICYLKTASTILFNTLSSRDSKHSSIFGCYPH
jgi:hypothetical protein